MLWWLCNSSLPACRFFPFGLVFVALCVILLLKETFSCVWVLAFISPVIPWQNGLAIWGLSGELASKDGESLQYPSGRREDWGLRQALLGSRSLVGDGEDLPHDHLLGRPGRAFQIPDALLGSRGVARWLHQPGSEFKRLSLQAGVSCRARYSLGAHRVRSRARSVPGAHRVHSRARSVPGAHRVHSRARSVPGAHRVRSKARFVPGAHRVHSRARSVPGAHRVRSKARFVPGAHRVHSRARSVPGAHRVHSRARSVPGAHRVRLQSSLRSGSPQSPLQSSLRSRSPQRDADSRWAKRTGERSLCGDGEARGHWADVSLLNLATQLLFFPHKSRGGRNMRGARGRVALWKESYPRSAERQDWSTCSAAFSPSVCSVSVRFPQVWHTLSVSVISIQGILTRLTMTARHLQQCCAEICSSSKACLDLTGLRQGMNESASCSLQEVQSSCWGASTEIGFSWRGKNRFSPVWVKYWKESIKQVFAL